jgi:hypothetical protein
MIPMRPKHEHHGMVNHSIFKLPLCLIGVFFFFPLWVSTIVDICKILFDFRIEAAYNAWTSLIFLKKTAMDVLITDRHGRLNNRPTASLHAWLQSKKMYICLFLFNFKGLLTNHAETQDFTCTKCCYLTGKVAVYK